MPKVEREKVFVEMGGRKTQRWRKREIEREKQTDRERETES